MKKLETLDTVYIYIVSYIYIIINSYLSMEKSIITVY